MKRINVGILAHVDAGKTTLSESLLYTSGTIRNRGRVDHQNAFLDYEMQERSRGITIYAKQAVFSWQNVEITLIDTPGHVDFSAEMERVLQVLDYAILLINATDGVQAHTETIWKLIQQYQIPAFIFVNKMDIAHQSKDSILSQLHQQFSSNCLDFSCKDDAFYEAVAMCDDSLLETYMEHMTITSQRIAKAVCERKVIPCFFGSALKIDGIEQLLHGLAEYTAAISYPDIFAGQIYKISRDNQGNRLTHMKITGGVLKVKTKLKEQDKVDQIRRYHGNKYILLQEAEAGMVVAVKGCDSLLAGDVVGEQKKSNPLQLASFMEYRMLLPDGCDQFSLLPRLQQLAEEEPQLHIRYIERTKEIRASFMGEVQIEIFQQLMKERFQLEVSFDQGMAIYKETILAPVEGIGHFEPLRHYAEVHLLLEPKERNSGLEFVSECLDSQLDQNWQRAILTHLQEKEHIGVLCGMPITDMKITLLCGKAHEKHTEGGDFRQATYRAVRQGLMQAKSVLLEPYVNFTLEVPDAYISKAAYDIESMHGSFQIETGNQNTTRIIGEGPAVTMQHYQQSVLSYTKGKGRFVCSLKGYEVCHNQEEVMHQFNYHCDTDVEHPSGSIFCAHGAGFYVSWNDVRMHMHVHSDWEKQQQRLYKETNLPKEKFNEADLKAIYERTYGKIKTRIFRKTETANESREAEIQPLLKECLLVDGYNMIHAWPELKLLAEEQQMDAARERLIHALCNYQGYRKCELILVFDAYLVVDGTGDLKKRDNIYIVYTKQAQTADMYIERATHQLASSYRVIVATSDGMEQLITMGQGARRLSSRQLIQDMDSIQQISKAEYLQQQKQHRTYLLEDIRKFEDYDDE